MLSSVYSISYKVNGKVERDLVSSSDILSALQLYIKTYPERLILSIVYQSSIVV